MTTTPITQEFINYLSALRSDSQGTSLITYYLPGNYNI